MRIAIACVAALGCARDSKHLKDGPTTGDPCTGSESAMLSAVPQGDATKYIHAYADLQGDRARISLLPSGSLSVSRCQLEWSGTGIEGTWTLSVDAQELGTFSVASGDALIYGVIDMATSGSVTLAGYDADLGRLCGSFEGTTDRAAQIRGRFVAEVFCE